MSKTKYLIDTGADISVIPKSNFTNLTQDEHSRVTAANGSCINTYGIKTLEVDLGLSKRFRHEFVISDIDTAIIGADFLYKFRLIPDLRNKKLIQSDTKLYVNAVSLVKCITPTPRLNSLNNEFGKILLEYPSLTSEPNFHSTPKHNIVHRIYTEGPLPYAKPRRLTSDRFIRAKKEFDLMVKMGICRVSKSQTSSPLTMQPKPNSTDLRPCGDYRRLNYLTIPDRYPLPLIQDFNAKIHNCKIFSKIDIIRAYHHIPVAEEDIFKTAITTPFGLYEFTRMPFGLRNAAQTFQRFINEVCSGLDFVFVYLDDLLIFSENEEQHKYHLRMLFQRLAQYGLNINPVKCLFGVKTLEFLGHHISEQGIKPSQSRVEAIVCFEQPQSLRKLQRFVGMINFYFRFIPKLACILIPLHEHIAKCVALNKKTKRTNNFTWTSECQLAFDKAKQGLINSVMLAHPSVNPTKISIVTDASNVAIGAVLQQKVKGLWKPLGFFSKKLQKSETKYSALDRELLAIYLAIKHFRYFVEGREFTVYTDHKPLLTLINSLTEKTPRQITHLNYISEFTSDIRHIKGSDNVVADFLSRIPEVDVMQSTYFDQNQPYVCELREMISIKNIIDSQGKDDEIHKILKDKRPDSKIQLELITLPYLKLSIWCEVSKFVRRPYIPTELRFKIFQILHSLSHPGIKATRKLVNRRYFWPRMNIDVGKWTKECMSCQKTKIYRHTKSPIETIKLPHKRFQHIHIDLVGPLPISNGYRYVLTVIDRYTRWPEAYPLRDITAENVVQCLVRNYVSRFGVPEIITTDRGSQFESDLFYEWCKQLGTTRTRTTAYHPQSNGLVERLHRTLKAAITASCRSYQNRNWYEALPLVLLGLRTMVKEDLKCSPAELVYGEALVIPGEYVVPVPTDDVDTPHFLEQLQDHVTRFKPIPTNVRNKTQHYIPLDLETCEFVLVRIDKLTPSLTYKYTGPYKVIKRLRKYFIIEINGKHNSVSIDRLKPCYGVTNPD